MDQDNVKNVLEFVKRHHTSLYEFIEPSKLRLHPNYSVCIIGASRGIGEHIAYAYAAAGAHRIILAGRPSSQTLLGSVAAKARTLNSNPGASVTISSVDLASSSEVADLARMVRAQIPRLDAVVFNAGFSGPVTLRIDDGEPADFRTCVDVNYLGAYHVAHWFLPLLRRDGATSVGVGDGDGGEGAGAGAFIVVSAMAALITRGPIANTGYCVSKMAQLRLVEMVAEQYGKEGVLAVAVHPGAVLTEMAMQAPEEFAPYLIDSPALCGGFCVWLCAEKEKRRWMNGRLLSATWDVEELLSKHKEIVEKDLLKFRMAI
ncbi:uncharacterized protein F4807DRAFT_152188 [Annulohypoxylon truncatum]|uniref:uncharacterized protein n=1 Tax=Annulohypoxylon truncatum TaxID=327061 RepID=UPI0020081196|nr:uncharacterized protein F4807DRAFT_152188 [Annulohypoxylon truncatum]KAI1208443.1 hypothetical protein F4807DRAFT_152188 [Annulohypoxylon truncatum]